MIYLLQTRSIRDVKLAFVTNEIQLDLPTFTDSLAYVNIFVTDK